METLRLETLVIFLFPIYLLKLFPSWLGLDYEIASSQQLKELHGNLKVGNFSNFPFYYLCTLSFLVG